MEDSQKSSRLSPLAHLGPLRRAPSVTRCELYWLPAQIPAKEEFKQWTTRFLLELVKQLTLTGELKPELFLEAEVIYPDLQEMFIQHALDFNPVMGFSRKPGAPLPSVPKNQYAEEIRLQKTPFQLRPFLTGVSYWFLKKQPEKQMELFWGAGGMTMLLVKADPLTLAPVFRIPNGVKKHPAFQFTLKEFDVQGMLDMAFSTQSSFLKKSKEYFGVGWENRVEYRGLMFVLPRWCSEDFFTLPEEELEHLFELCDLFVTESDSDKGVILASKKPLEDVIHQVVAQLAKEGLSFPQ